SSPIAAHHITFRVWDGNSRTKFSEDTGFVSEAHSIWRGPFLEPLSFEGQGQQALMLLANLYQSMCGGSSSSFVSLSKSLLQVMVRV
ncbi:hypothetical protein EJ02DRAFT_490196, partial [Clathrospora elynae]